MLNARKFFPIFFSILITSCASGPKFSQPIAPKEGMAAIYVYRPWTFAGGAGSPTIQLDNTGTEKLVNGSYLRFEATPGKHKIAIEKKFDFITASTWPPLSIDINPEAGKEYYIRYSTAAEIRPGGLYVTVIQFEYAFQEVPKDVALEELQREKK